MNESNHTINVALPSQPYDPASKLFHHYFRVITTAGEVTARRIASELQTLYPTANITITYWSVTGKEVHI